jgi:hypothetical protein
MARRAIALAMSAPMSEDDRRAVLLDAMLEFAPEVFALLQGAASSAGHVVLSDDTVSRALAELDTLRAALRAEVDTPDFGPACQDHGDTVADCQACVASVAYGERCRTVRAASLAALGERGGK